MIQNPMYIYAALAIVGTISVLIDIIGHGKTLSSKQAIGWSVFWVTVGLGFGGIIYFLEGGEAASEYYAGYAMEKVLSVDNLVVFVAVFSYFNIKSPTVMHKILTAGIIGAIVFRGVFVGVGSALYHLHWGIQVIFGMFVLYSAAGVINVNKGTPSDFDTKWYIRGIKRFYPITPDSGSGKFFVRINGVRHITPLLLCVVAIEFSDIIFAFDSVPVILGISKETAIVYSAIIMAVLGLRALFFLLKDALDKFEYLDKSVAIILIFIGVKIILAAAGIHMDPILSMCLVLSVLILGILASFIPKKSK